MENNDQGPLISLENKNQEEKISELIQFIGDNRTRQERGWFEHTCDWDAFLQIELFSGEIIETPSGYDSLEILGYTPSETISQNADQLTEIEIFVDREIIDTPDEEQDEPIPKQILIKDIKSLIWTTY